MFKNIFFIFFFCFLLPSDNLEKNIFNYSFNNKYSNFSKFSLKVLKSNNNFTNFQTNWLPSDNLIISADYVSDNTSNNSFSSENNFYYSISFTLLLNGNIYSGFGINTLKYDNIFNNLKWVEYFFNKNFEFKNDISFNFGLSYLYRNDNSFFKTNIYLDKLFYNNFILCFGFESAISSSNNKIYLGINYLL